MRVRVVASACFLGVIAAFVGFSFDWVITAHGEATYGMSGETTVIDTGTRGEEISATQGGEPIGKRLREYLEAKDLTLLIGSAGDGFPRLLVAGDADALPWFDPSRVSTGEVLLFAGSYSQQCWESMKDTPFLPKHATVRGVISAPEGAGDLQYVQVLTDEVSLPPGTYVVNTQDREVLKEFAGVLSASGLQIHGSQEMPLFEFLIHDPLLGVTLALFLLAMVVSGIHWGLLSLTVGSAAWVRRQCGARIIGLIVQESLKRLLWIGLGVALGVFLAAAIVSLVGRVPLLPKQWVYLTGSYVLTVLTALVVSAVGSFVALRSRKESEDVA